MQDHLQLALTVMLEVQLVQLVQQVQLELLAQQVQQARQVQQALLERMETHFLTEQLIPAAQLVQMEIFI